MAIRNIVIDGDEILTKKCRDIEKFDDRLHTLLDDMAETMYDAGGVGLAAPQVGIIRKAVVIDIGEGLIELINPKIVMYSGEQQEIEGCLSCPGLYGITKRPMHVTVNAQDRNGEEITVSGSGFLAKALCHEIDHLNGILFKEKIIKIISEDDLVADE